MTQVDDDIKFGMIEAISHLIHRDYEAIVQVGFRVSRAPSGMPRMLARVFGAMPALRMLRRMHMLRASWCVQVPVQVGTRSGKPVSQSGKPCLGNLFLRECVFVAQDFVTLQFIPPGTDLQPILPVLAKVFDQVRAASSTGLQQTQASMPAQ